MIDTIVLRIHNIDKYKIIYEQFYRPEKKKGQYTQALVDSSTGELKQVDYVHQLIYHDTDRFLPLMHRSTNYIASSHYNLSYLVNQQKGFIEFNFSIPKYLWGTNIMQLVNIYDQSADLVFTELMAFLQTFFKDVLFEIPLADDVEINRIDMCYNQFFATKDDALAYLSEQGKMLVKFARSSKNKFRTYDTSIMYVTRRYSFKIYHKGTEFEKNDYRELVKRNPKNYNLQELKDVADTILRYEMTFRNSFFDYIIHQFFYSSEKQAFTEAVKNHKVARAFNNQVSFGGQKIAEEFFKKSKTYYLKSVWEYRLEFDVLYQSYSMTFDKTLFRILAKVFWDKVKQYQVQRQLDIVEIDRRITEKIEKAEQINKLRKPSARQLNQGRVRLMCAALLSHYTDIQNIKKYVPASSYDRLKADLKSIGIDTISHSLVIAQPKLDYFDYKIHFSKYH